MVGNKYTVPIITKKEMKWASLMVKNIFISIFSFLGGIFSFAFLVYKTQRIGFSFFDRSSQTLSPRYGVLGEEWTMSLYLLMVGVALFMSAYTHGKKVIDLWKK